MSTEITNNENQTQRELLEKEIASHDYDGIKELNNPAPNWIWLLFLGTIGFALIYLVIYFGYPGNKMSQSDEYEKSVTAYNAQKDALKQADGGSTMNETEMIAMGEKLFKEKGCIACHGVNGEGNNIGPNLTDKFWINGCSQEQVVHIITEGKPEKGMTPFKSMMSQDQIASTATYIRKSLVGSNPTNAKAAQGEACE